MKKIKSFMPIIIFIALCLIIFIFSIYNLKTDEENNRILKDVLENIIINKLELNIDYYKGKEINDYLSFGNISSHEIRITNNNNEKVSFALYFDDQDLSNDLVTYDISYKINDSNPYEIISKNNDIKDNVLLYNITIDERKDLYLKIDFKSNKEGDHTSIKGTLRIDNNVSETETFNQGIYKIQKNIEDKIDSLNGISESGYYTLNIKSFIDDDTANFKGVVFINAMDITDLSFYYMVHNDKYMINDYYYTSETIRKSDILAIDEKVIGKFNEDNICLLHTKKKCLAFSEIKYNEKGDKKNFINACEEAIKLTKEKHKHSEKRVYIYDIVEDIADNLSLRGYILIDNTNSKSEYYLYLTNELYMVSGYNLTKYGMFNETSTTIRAYNETSFKLSSESKKKVCKFTGFTDCYDTNNKKI